MSEKQMSEKQVSVDNKEAETDLSTGAIEAIFEEADAEFEEGQVFKQVKDGVNFRTVGWKEASFIFLKGKYSHATA
jgi:hypothetical protein